MQRSSPLPSTGLSRLEASMVPPEVAPAPMTVWISSMNRIASRRSRSASITPLMRSSKSPRNRVPASSAPRSRAMMRIPRNIAGTSPAAMRHAIPSTIAVLPTPASPTSTGLFLWRRPRICRARATSGPRPISGSKAPAAARAVRSAVNRSSICREVPLRASSGGFAGVSAAGATSPWEITSSTSTRETPCSWRKYTAWESASSSSAASRSPACTFSRSALRAW